MTVRAFGREWPTFDDGRRRRVLIGIDLAVMPGRYPVAITAGQAQTTYPLVVKARAFATRRLTVDPDLVTPPPEALERIARETRELERAWADSGDTNLWDGPFVRPVKEPANSAFGRRSVFNGQPRSAARRRRLPESGRHAGQVAERRQGAAGASLTHGQHGDRRSRHRRAVVFRTPLGE